MKFDLFDEQRTAHQFMVPTYIGVQNHDVPLQVTACGLQQPRTIVIGCNRPYGLNDYLLIYLHKGCGLYQINGESKLVQAGNIIVFRPREPQIIQYLPEYKSLVSWVHFTGSYDESLLQSCHLKGQVTACGCSDTLACLFMSLIDELEKKDTNYELQCVSTLLSIAAQISRMVASVELSTHTGKPDSDDNIRKIVQMLNTRFSEHWSVPALARICCLAPNYFIASFKKQTGFTPIEYLNLIRIRKADDLLVFTNLSIKEIARQSGFDNPLYFSRRYADSFGFPPSARRKYFEKPVE